MAVSQVPADNELWGDPSLRITLSCPSCWAPAERLAWNASGAVCLNCSADYPVENGIWYAIVPEREWRTVLQDTVALFHDFSTNRDAALALANMNMQQEIEDHGTRHTEHRDASFFQNWDRLEVPKSARILEVGAGDLRVSSQLVRRGYDRLVAYEAVPEFLNRGLFDKGLSIPKICGSASRLPFADGAFDFVYAHAMLHHLERPETVLREMGRVLRTGGTLAVFDEPVIPVTSRVDRIRKWEAELAFDIGINETLPHFGTYYRGLRQARIGRISASVNPDEMRLPRRLRLLGFDQYWFVGKPEASGLRMHLRHLLLHGCVTLQGIRMPDEVPKPSPILPCNYAFSARDYIYSRTKACQTAIWRSLFSPEEVPRSIVVGKNDVLDLRRGFSRRMFEFETPTKWASAKNPHVKWLQAEGAAFLRVSRADNFLCVLGKDDPEAERPTLISAWQDGLPLEPVYAGGWTGLKPSEFADSTDDSNTGTWVPVPNVWTEMRWKLRPPIDLRREAFPCEFRLRADRITNREGIPTSVMVRKLECHR